MRLVTWNTQSCRGIDGRVSPERIVKHARALGDFDVLCLQEIASHYPAVGAPGDQLQELAALLPGFTLLFGAAVEEFDLQGDGSRRRFGNLVATRLPVAEVRHHALPYPADPGVESMPRMCTVVTLVDPELGALRVMTTHLEFYSRPQRMAQARAVRELQIEYCAQADGPPKPGDEGSPDAGKLHTRQALLCGDFNLQPQDAEHAAIIEPFAGGAWWDAWPLLHGEAPRPPTFSVHEVKYTGHPVTFDFVFVSDELRPRLRSFVVDTGTQASDHQPMLVELGAG